LAIGDVEKSEGVPKFVKDYSRRNLHTPTITAVVVEGYSTWIVPDEGIPALVAREVSIELDDDPSRGVGPIVWPSLNRCHLQFASGPHRNRSAAPVDNERQYFWFDTPACRVNGSNVDTRIFGPGEEWVNGVAVVRAASQLAIESHVERRRHRNRVECDTGVSRPL
jgi:hypothetical protein